jgi:OOP family OmpA-OmpF porin
MRHALLALLFAFSTAAAAQDTGWYVGGSFGTSDVADFCTGVSGPGISCDDEDSAWRLLGGYQLNRNFALELGYSNLGEVGASGPGGTVTAEATAWELVGVGSIPLGAVSLYGKAGVYRGETDASINTVLLVGSASESNTDLTFGAGVRFDVARNVAMRGEWQRYQDIGGGEIGESDVDVLSVGVLVRF